MTVIARSPPIRPRPTLWHWLDSAARRALPLMSALLLTLALALPFGLPHQRAVSAALLLDMVLFWSVHRPASMAPPAVFVIGLIADLAGQGLVGGTALALLLVQSVALGWRRPWLRRGFGLEYGAVVVLACIYAVLQWGLHAIDAGRALPVAPALSEAVLAILAYPVLAALMLRFHHGPADPDQAF